MIILRPIDYPALHVTVVDTPQLLFTQPLVKGCLAPGDLIEMRVVLRDLNTDTNVDLGYLIQIDAYLDGTPANIFTDGIPFLHTQYQGGPDGPAPGILHIYPFSQSILFGFDGFLYNQGGQTVATYTDNLAYHYGFHSTGGVGGVVPSSGLVTANDATGRSSVAFDRNIEHRISLVFSMSIFPPTLDVVGWNGGVLSANIFIYQPANGNSSHS